MSFSKKTIKDIDIRGKRVLVRADYNVPLDDKRRITSDFRIRQSAPTIQYLVEQGCRVVICSHLGRPDGHQSDADSLAPVAERLSSLVGRPVQFALDCVGPIVEETVARLQPGEVLLLENLRFHPGEEANDPAFAAELAKNGEIFVQDGFGVVHRAHASTEGVTHLLPSVAGLLLQKEVDTITRVMESPERPLVAIVGGAKISDKIEVLERLIDIADFVAVGGAMANTFLLAEGISVGDSKVEPDAVGTAKRIIDKAKAKAKQQDFVFYIPQDGVVAETVDKTAHTRIVDWQAHVIASVENYPARPPRATAHVSAKEKILDIGPFSASFIAGGMQLAKTVIWNGTMGVTETPGLQGPIGPFAHGTELLIEAMIGQFGHRPFTVVGGGDTAGYVDDRGINDLFNHVSTGGGASMDLMSGKKLPGVEALQDA